MDQRPQSPPRPNPLRSSPLKSPEFRSHRRLGSGSRNDFRCLMASPGCGSKSPKGRASALAALPATNGQPHHLGLSPTPARTRQTLQTRYRRRHEKTPPPHPIPHQKSKTFPFADYHSCFADLREMLSDADGGVGVPASRLRESPRSRWRRLAPLRESPHEENQFKCLALLYANKHGPLSAPGRQLLPVQGKGAIHTHSQVFAERHNVERQ